MRLINLDDVIKFYLGYPSNINEDFLWNAKSIILNLLDIPTVDAIPIHWITAWISSHDEIDGKQMLLDWYKQK